MSQTNTGLLVIITLMAPMIASADVDFQLRTRQLPGWDARVREGRCEIHVWVDRHAEVRMRGDGIFVRTVEGSRSRDGGSECSQPLPYNAVRGFQIRQISGRSRVVLAQQPSRSNNYTAMIAINDEGGGGDNYTFEVNWRGDENLGSSPAPFFDDVRACQDAVRLRFHKQNGRDSYIDFNGFAERLDQNDQRGRGRRNQGRESIQGRGTARNQNESRELTYSCEVEVRQNRVLSGGYQYRGESYRSNDRFSNRPILR